MAKPPKKITKPNDEIMSDDNYRASVDFSTSCTRDEAVLNLLGWIRGTIQSQDADHIFIEDMPSLNPLIMPLKSNLENTYKNAKVKYYEAMDASLSQDDVNTLGDEMDMLGTFIGKAERFACDIDDELTKGEKSELRIDKIATEKNGVTHITLASLDEWAEDKFEINIFGPLAPLADENANADDSSSKPELSRTLSENLLTTLAFLAEVFVPDSDLYRREDKSLITKNVAAAIEKAATKANGGQKLSTQSTENIRKLLSKALKIKDSKLPESKRQ